MPMRTARRSSRCRRRRRGRSPTGSSPPKSNWDRAIRPRRRRCMRAGPATSGRMSSRSPKSGSFGDSRRGAHDARRVDRRAPRPPAATTAEVGVRELGRRRPTRSNHPARLGAAWRRGGRGRSTAKRSAQARLAEGLDASRRKVHTARPPGPSFSRCPIRARRDLRSGKRRPRRRPQPRRVSITPSGTTWWVTPNAFGLRRHRDQSLLVLASLRSHGSFQSLEPQPSNPRGLLRAAARTSEHRDQRPVSHPSPPASSSAASAARSPAARSRPPRTFPKRRRRDAFLSADGLVRGRPETPNMRPGTMAEEPNHVKYAGSSF